MRKMIYGLLTISLVAILALPAIAADESNMKAKAAAWEKEYNSGNLEAVAALYAADGCRMPPNQETAKGTQGILAALKGGKQQGIDKVKIGVTSAETMGNMGWATGTYEITGPDGKHADHGKWMNVSKKVNGEWKIQCDIWNSNMAAPAASM
jgi:ketosteroid isomerase-like protein